MNAEGRDVDTAAADDAGLAPLEIVAVDEVADGIRAYTLARPDRGELPPFTPGAHVTLRVPDGPLRKYSLCGDPAERTRWRIAVKREDAGRGGSRALHERARVGDRLAVSAPANAFGLVAAPAYLFVAGGIGITPILSMIRSFGDDPPAPWTLVYLSRDARSAAFLDELAEPRPRGRVIVHHDAGDPARAFDLWPLLEKPGRTHVYCCGPRPLMDAVRDMTGHWTPGRVHFESFVDGAAPRPQDRPFAVRLARSGTRLEVPVGRTILEVLREAGHVVPSSCESGTCGSCRTGLVAGEAEHRDLVLFPDEQATHIMVCVSRGRGDELVLDL